MTSVFPPRSKHKADHSPLRELMVQAVKVSGLTHNEIAAKAGLSRSCVSYVLCGHRTGSLDTWNAILGATGVRLAAQSGGLVLRMGDEPFSQKDGAA